MYWSLATNRDLQAPEFRVCCPRIISGNTGSGRRGLASASLRSTNQRTTTRAATVGVVSLALTGALSRIASIAHVPNPSIAQRSFAR